MGVIVFASLKGGVGKTSLSINVAHALARRGCRTLLIDLDPAGHSTRFFIKPGGHSAESPLARLFFEAAKEELSEAPLPGEDYLHVARPDLELLSSGEELRHFLWGKGNQLFARYFPKLLKRLKVEYDHVVVDTPPDFNTLTRNSLAAADLALVPVDASAMSIYSLEELLLSAQHLDRPTWGIVRTMVGKKARKSQRLSNERLQQKFDVQLLEDSIEADDEEFDVEDPASFMSMLQNWEREKAAQGDAARPDLTRSDATPPPRSEKPIYLLRSLIYRTETQNQLTFSGKTSLDTRQSAALADQYLAVAREVESLLTSKETEGTGGPSTYEEPDDSDYDPDRLEMHA